MSHTIALQLEQRPQVSSVLQGIPFPNLRVRQDLDTDGEWPTQPVQLWLDNISVRPTEVTCRSNNRVEIRLHSLAAPEDCELAIGIAERIGLAANKSVESDVYGQLDPGELRSTFHAAWIREQAVKACRALTTLIDDGHGPIEIPGPVRPFYIGERLLGDLRNAGPEEDLVDRVMDAIRMVQYLPEDQYFHAGTFEAESTETGEKIHFAVWGPGHNYVIPAVRLVLVSAPTQEDDVFLIASESIQDIAPDRCHWLDERQRLVMEFTEAEWPDLMARARDYEVKP